MPAQATIDISARITGYQTSLNQLRQAINQLDPGSSIRKSLQTAFKSTESYINKLAKTPVVNVGSDKQLQSLINTLDKASSMVSGISSQLREVRFDDLNADILKDALDDINKQLSETTDKLNQAANGPQLSTLASKVKNLDTVFNGLGKNINDLGAIEGVNILNDALEESKERAEQAKEALDDVQKRINAWKPPEDATGLFGSKSGGKGTKLLKELDTSEVFKNIDFDKAGFSKEAVEHLKTHLTEQLKASLKSDYLKEGVAENISWALSGAFDEGLNAANLSGRISKFLTDIKGVFNQNSIEFGNIFSYVFGGKTTTLQGGTNFADNLLRQVTISMNAGAERLRQIIEVVSHADLANDKPLIKLVEEGQFDKVKQQLTAILQTAKQAYVEMRQLPTGLSDERTQAQERLAAANNDVKNISAVQQQIINTQEYQQAITKIQQLENQVIELRTALSELQAQKVDTVHQTADDVDKAGQSFKITAEQAEQYRNKLDEIQEKEKLLGKIQGVVERWFSIYAAIRLVSNAVRSMISTVEELDKTITNIAIVTNMSQNDLWQQMPTYTKTAREFAASISGVYEVSQLYYQQGLQTVDVMKLTEQTLKMARISGLDYAESTDYMTNALRSFKMQMQDAQRIVDVYSAVAASSATNVEELAEAMSKTASSAEAVGSSFENTTAMMAVMIEATRQAPENIGSALKSIISRYGELKVNPATLVDSEGQELSLNKVDTALQSVGISIHDAAGQFRDFDDVIMDLAKSWNTIDKNTQRYIATVMAGNRQQSRFLALVSSYQRLKEEAEIAANSQNAAQLQYLKTLDSIEAKQQQLQTSMQSLYTSTGIQNFYKTLIDLGNSVVQSFTNIPTILNLPIPALLKFGTTFYNIATLVTQMYSMLRAKMNVQTKAYEGAITANLELEAAKRRQITEEEYKEKVQAAQKAADTLNQIERGVTTNLNEQATLRQKIQGFFTNKKNVGMVASAVGMAATLGATVLPTDTAGQRGLKSALTGIGGLAQGVGTGLMMGGPAGAIMGVLTALPAAIEAVGIAIETTEEKIERYDKAIQDANNKKLISENEFKTLTDYDKRLKDLKEHQNDSNEARQEFLTLNAEIAANYPELISGIDAQGNLIVELGAAYKQLAQNKRAAYADDIIKSGETQLQAFNNLDWLMNQFGISAKQLDKQYGTNGLFQNLNGSALKGVQDTAAFMQALSPQLKTDKDIRTWLKGLGTDSWGYLEGSLGSAIDLRDVIDNPQYNGELLSDIREIINAKLQKDGTTILDFFTQLPEFSNRSDIEQQIQNIGNYRDNVIEGILTSTIAALRQGLDALNDPNHDTVTGLAGVYMNKQLRTSYDTYAQNTQQRDPSKVLKNWAKGENLEDSEEGFQVAYNRIFGKITTQTEQAAFQQLNQYYQDIGNLTIEQYNKIADKYSKDSKAKEAWDTFEAEYKQVQDQVNKIFYQAMGGPAYYNYSANTRKRIASLKNKENIDLKRFSVILEGQGEESINSILNIIESGTTDSISGIEDIIKKYGETFNVNPETDYDVFVKIMRQFENTVRINFNTEYQTLAESYTSHLKEFDKALKNATSGMGYEDAVALANQLGITLGKFQQREGKFYLDDLNIIKNKLMPGQDGLKQVLQNRAKIVEQAFNNGTLDKYKDDLSDDAFKALDGSEQQIYTAIKGFRQSGYELTQAGWNAYISSLQQTYEALDKATQYIIQSNWLSTGNVDKFLKSIKDGSANGIKESELYTKALKGQLTGELAQFSQQIIELYQKNTTAVYDAVTKLISGQSISESVVATDTNRELIEKILGKKLDDSQIGQAVQIPAEKAAENFNKTLYSLLGDQSYNWKARIEAAGKLWEAAFSTSNFRLDALKSAINSSFQDLDFATWGALPESIKLLADYNKTTGKFFVDLNQAAQVINAQSLIDEGFTKKEANELIATLRKNTREKDIKTIASELVKNRESLTEENISSIATALNQTYDEVIATLQLQRNEDGTYRMNMNSILQLMEQKKGQLDTVLAQMIAEEIDNIIGNVSNIASDQGKGTTKFVDMQKAVTRAQEAGFKVETVNDLYEWDEAVRGYVLKSEGLFIELAQARMELESLGQNQQQARDLLQHQIDSIGRELANNVDITKYISSPNNWNQNTEVFKNFKKSLEDLNKYFEATGQAIYNIDIVMSSLRQGGVGAVNIAQQIAKLQGIDLSNDDVNKIFRAKVDYILEANDQLTATAGEIISQDAGNFLNTMQSGAQLKRLENGSYLVIKSAEDLTKAYLNIYDELVKSGQATVEQLNVAAARYFYAQAKTSKLDALNDIANAAEVTYDELADLFINAGWTMSTSIFKDLEGVIENLGNGKARILNFSAFADALGIDKSTDEYFKALQNFNDSLIDSLNDTRNHVAEQIEDLSKAGPSDLINVTQLQKNLGDKFTEIFSKYGTIVSDGVFQITQATNLPALIKEITMESTKAGKLLTDEVKNLIDVVNQLYKDMADTIVDGMKGGLSNTDANYLKTQASSNFGLDINFTQSYQGLKLSTDQAIKLYNELKKVDSVSAHLVFEELTEQLTKSGEALESMSHAMAEIKRLEAQGTKQAKERAKVYREIADMQLNNPDAYDFMGNALPDYLKGPENYWNSLGKAFKALNEAAKPPKEGALGQGNYLDVTDFYNIVNEFNNLAQLGGKIEFLGMKLDGSLESASALIQKGMNTLTNIDGQGVKIDLSKIGASFTGGAEGMAKGVDQGIKEMAKSQIKMLDGMIQLLETVVAMEGLKDVADDTGDENVIDLTDIFPKIEVNPEDFTVNEKIISWIDKLFASDNQDLQKAFTNVKFGTKTLKQILTDLKNGSIQSKQEAEQAQQALNALYQMYLSGDYSLQNLIGSIKQVLGSSGYEGQVQVGDTKLYISQGFVLEHGEQGWQVPGAGSFTNVNDALSAYRMQTVEGAKNAKTKGGVTTAELVIGSETVDVVTTKDSLTYLVGNKKCKTYNEAAHEAYKQYVKQFRTENSADAIPLDESQWRIQNNVILESSVSIENPEQVKNATHKQIQELAQALVSGEDIEAKAQAVGINVKIQGDITQADFQKIASAAGIDTKTLALSLATEVVGDNAENVKKILAGQNLTATVDIEVGNDATGLFNSNGGTATKQISEYKVTQADNFKVTGLDDIWAKLPKTKDQQLMALITKIGVDKDNSNYNPDFLKADIMAFLNNELTAQDLTATYGEPVYALIQSIAGAAGDKIDTNLLADAIAQLIMSCQADNLFTSETSYPAIALIDKILIKKDEQHWQPQQLRHDITAFLEGNVSYDDFVSDYGYEAIALIDGVGADKALGEGFSTTGLANMITSIIESDDVTQMLNRSKTLTLLINEIAGDNSQGYDTTGLVTVIDNIWNDVETDSSLKWKATESLTLAITAIDALPEGINKQDLINGIQAIWADNTPTEDKLKKTEILTMAFSLFARNDVGSSMKDTITGVIDTIFKNNVDEKQLQDFKTLMLVLDKLFIDDTQIDDKQREQLNKNLEIIKNKNIPADQKFQAVKELIALITSISASESTESANSLEADINSILGCNDSNELQQTVSKLIAKIGSMTAEKADANIQLNTSQVLPDGPVDLGSREGILTITDIKTKTGKLGQASGKNYQQLKNELGYGGIHILGLQAITDWGFWHGSGATKELKGSSEFADAVLKELTQLMNELQTDATRVIEPWEIGDLLKLQTNSELFTINGQSVPDYIERMFQIDRIKKEKEEFNNGILEAFKEIDSTAVQECATAMGELAENAQKVKDVPWAELVSGVNSINNIETPDEDLATASTIMRTVQASLSIVAATDDKVAAEVISLDPIQRTVQLLADAKSIQEALTDLQAKITVGTNEVNTVAPVSGTIPTAAPAQVDTSGINALSSALQKAVSEAENIFDELTTMLTTLRSDSDASANTISNLSDTIGSIPQGRDQRVGALAVAMDRIPAVSGRISSLNSALNALANKVIHITLEVSLSGQPGSVVKGTVDGKTLEVGKPVTLSFAKGNAAAKGKTLVGQLGPELVVSNGRYYVVGQAGAQMVSLPDDAIVFNHIQTQNLLKKERGGGRGKPVTNEHNAVSFAKGTGSAMASASSALAALKQIRAMWQSMLTASMKDLGSLAGQEVGKASKSSGGSGSNNNKDQEQVRAVLEEIERWYNLLRQIDRLQKDITYQQTLQAEIESDRVANGRAMYRSYKQEIEYLDQQIIRNQQLADLQKSWYERKRNELASSDYGRIFTYDENGQLQYRDGANYGLDILEKLTQRNIYGATVGVAANASTQINYLKSLGFNIDKLKYNDDGTIIDASSEDYIENPDQMYEDMMENFWNNLDGWKDELDSIYDSYREQLNNVLSNETKRNQLLQKIIDNQLSVEQDVLKAIESREQKIIDELQNERDALQKSNKEFIDGLTDQLNQQKQMYQNAQSEKELVKLRRQISILQRSGGSATQIRSLQQQVAAKEQDQYFTSQQQQIAAIQKASDLQIQRLDSQIDLMTETLKFQKQNGVLWEEVYQIMASTPQQIRQFITENTPDFQSASALDVAQKIRDIDLRINEWIGYRDDENAPSMTGDHYYDWDSYSAARTSIYGNRASDQLKNQAKEEFDRILQATGDINRAGAAADAIFRAVLGDVPGVNSNVTHTKINSTKSVAQAIADRINDNYNQFVGNSNSNKSNIVSNVSSKVTSTKSNVNANTGMNTKTSTSSTSSSEKKTFTFTSTKQQENLMSDLDKLQRQLRNDMNGLGMVNPDMLNEYNQKYKRLTTKNKEKYKLFKTGGLVNYTGLAQVDGTPQRPEAFLNAEQTELLRNHLFGRSDSLLSLAQQLVQQLHGASYSSSTLHQEENNGINIQNVDVNVNVKQIANDYDVRSIGNTVMDEMLKIARKSGTRGLSRR